MLHNVTRAKGKFSVAQFLVTDGPPLCRLASTTLCGGRDYVTHLISLTTGLKRTTLWIMHFVETVFVRVVSDGECTGLFDPCQSEIWRTGEYQSVRRRQRQL
ncbi:hypothetical protein B8W69_23595, partial [Mycobacterium vulneris]